LSFVNAGCCCTAMITRSRPTRWYILSLPANTDASKSTPKGPLQRDVLSDATLKNCEGAGSVGLNVVSLDLCTNILSTQRRDLGHLLCSLCSQSQDGCRHQSFYLLSRTSLVVPHANESRDGQDRRAWQGYCQDLPNAQGRGEHLSGAAKDCLSRGFDSCVDSCGDVGMLWLLK
jgi:hypothetical protein